MSSAQRALPFSIALHQMKAVRLGCEGARESPGLKIVRQHHGGVIAFFQQTPERSEVGLGTAVCDQHMVAGRAVPCGDVLAKFLATRPTRDTSSREQESRSKS